MRNKYARIAAGLAFFLAGCATQQMPQHNSQQELTPAGWKNDISDLASPTVNWKSFGDPVLDELIDIALQKNPDITTAIESLNSSRINREDASAARGVVYAIGTGASTTKSRDVDSSEFYNLTGSASYELDIWGRRRDDVTLAELDIISAESSLLTTRISLAAEVADAYFSIRVSDAQLEYKQQALDYILKQQSQIEARRAAGIVTGVEVDRQEVEVQRLRFQIEDLKGSRSLQEDRLATLTGRAPQAFSLSAIEKLFLPAVHLEPDLPAEVLRARPDIRSAEARLEASAIRFGLAKKAFYPTISLTGNTGYSSASLSELLKDASWGYTASASLIATLLDNGARTRNVERARIAAAQQIASYRKSILAALSDVESALNQQEVSLRQLEIQKLSLASQERVTREAEARYRLGSTSGFELINQQRALLTQHESILSIQLSGIQATIRLFRAVGVAPQ